MPDSKNFYKKLQPNLRGIVSEKAKKVQRLFRTHNGKRNLLNKKVNSPKEPTIASTSTNIPVVNTTGVMNVTTQILNNGTKGTFYSNPMRRNALKKHNTRKI